MTDFVEGDRRKLRSTQVISKRYFLRIINSRHEGDFRPQFHNWNWLVWTCSEYCVCCLPNYVAREQFDNSLADICMSWFFWFHCFSIWMYISIENCRIGDIWQSVVKLNRLLTGEYRELLRKNNRKKYH